MLVSLPSILMLVGSPSYSTPYTISETTGQDMKSNIPFTSIAAHRESWSSKIVSPISDHRDVLSMSSNQETMLPSHIPTTKVCEFSSNFIGCDLLLGF